MDLYNVGKDTDPSNTEIDMTQFNLYDDDSDDQLSCSYTYRDEGWGGTFYLHAFVHEKHSDS